MKVNTFLILFLLTSCSLFSQNWLNIDQKEFFGGKNIEVQSLSSNQHSSSFLIVVEDSVRKHYHSEHTESLYVLEGSGKILLGDEIIVVKKGDFITIQPKTVHAVWVESDVALKVLSIQAPEFKGSDRIFIEE